MGVKEMVAEAKGRVREISPQDVKRALDEGDDLLLVDVGEPHEYAEGHLPGALNVPRGMLELKAMPIHPSRIRRLRNAPARRSSRIASRRRARSLFAAETLSELGFRDVAAMSADANGWAEAGLPLDRL